MLRELLASFAVDGSQAATALQTIDKKIEGVKGTLGALASAFVGSALVSGMRSFVEGQIEIGSRTNDLSEKLGVSSDELQRFQFAAMLSGVGAEEAAKGLQFLNKNIGEAIGGNKEAVETFQKLGITLKDGAGVREVGDMLPEISKAFEGMGSDAERTAMAMKIFGKAGASLIPLLKDGPGGLAALSKEFDRLGGGMSKEFVAAADKAGDEIDKLKFSFAGWKSQIAFAVLPTITNLVTRFQGWVGTLRKMTRETDLARDAWILFGAGSAAAGLKSAAGFGKLLGILPKNAGFWETVLGLGELLLAAAGVLLLGLVLQDLFTFVQGGDSVIGELITKFLGAEEATRLANDLNTSWALIKETLSTLKPDLDGIATTLINIGKDSLPFMIGMFVDLLRLITAAVVQTTAFVSALGQLPGAIKNLDFSGIGKTFAAADAKTFGANGLFANGSAAVNSLKGPTSMPGGQADVTGSVSAPGWGGSGSEVSITQTNKIDITVDGGATPRETGAAVKDGVKAGLNAASLRDAYGAVGTGG